MTVTAALLRAELEQVYQQMLALQADARARFRHLEQLREKESVA